MEGLIQKKVSEVDKKFINLPVALRFYYQSIIIINYRNLNKSSTTKMTSDAIGKEEADGDDSGGDSSTDFRSHNNDVKQKYYYYYN